MPDISPIKAVIIAVAIALAVLAFDLGLPSGVAAGVPYVALVLVGIWLPKPAHVFILASVGTVLSIIGYFASTANGEEWVAITNRGLAIFSIWITAFLIAYGNRLKKSLHTAINNLEIEAAERTREFNERNALVNLLHGVAVAANKATCVEDAMRACLKEICTYTGWPIGHVYVASNDEPGLLVPTNIWHIDDVERFATFKKITEETTFRTGIGLPGRVMESKRATWITDVGEDPNFPRARLADEIASHTGLGIPIIVADKVVAVLEFFSTSIYEPDETLLNVVDNIGNQLGRVIERDLADKEIRKSHEELKLRVEERTMELAKSTREAKLANRAKSEILANTSHELRTPLNAIIGFSDIMKSEIFGPINDKYMEYLDDISISGEHLLELINDILDVSAIEVGKVKLDECNIDIRKITGDSIRIIKNRANYGGVHLNTDIDKNMPMLYADERRVKQILINLLSNAVKFTLANGIVLLSISYSKEGGHVFTVTDTGIGMDEEELAKAMSEFGQVGSCFTRGHEGTGLGLPLTKGLVEVHGGTLDIVSNKGKGTTVTVRFPPERTVN